MPYVGGVWIGGKKKFTRGTYGKHVPHTIHSPRLKKYHSFVRHYFKNHKSEASNNPQAVMRKAASAWRNRKSGGELYFA